MRVSGETMRTSRYGLLAAPGRLMLNFAAGTVFEEDEESRRRGALRRKMAGYTAGASRVVQALQAAEDERETVWVNVALIAMLDVSTADSVLSRVLRMDSVWDSTMREQLRQGMSGKPGTEHLRPRRMSGFRLQLLLEKAERFKEEDRDALVAERHLAKALEEMTREELRTQGISPERLVEEVTTLELSPNRDRIQSARELERLRFAREQDAIRKEVHQKSEVMRSRFAQAGHGLGSGTMIRAIIEIHVTGLQRMAEAWLGIRRDLVQRLSDLASREQLEALGRDIAEMIDAQWANLHIAVARWVGGVSQEEEVRRVLDSGEWQDTPLKIKSHMNREAEIIRKEAELEVPAITMPSPSRGSDGDQVTGDTDGEFNYDVAISYAGPQRELAQALAEKVREAGFRVFFDGYYPEELWGKDLAEYFDRVFRRDSRYCVILASKHYLESMWAIHERRSAVARSIKERGQEYILPIMVEKVEVPGLPPTIGYVTLDDYPLDRIADMLVAKLGKGRTGPLPGQQTVGVQLAEGVRRVLAAMLRNVGGRYPYSFWYKEDSLRLSVPNTDVVIEGTEARYIRDELLDGGYVEQWHPGIYRLTRRGEELGKSF